MCILRYIFGFEGIVSLIYLAVSKSCNRTEFNQTYDNSRMGQDRIYGNWEVIKAGTNARYQNLLVSKCYLTCKY